jgi:hypothetical protein
MFTPGDTGYGSKEEVADAMRQRAEMTEILRESLQAIAPSASIVTWIAETQAKVPPELTLRML